MRRNIKHLIISFVVICFGLLGFSHIISAQGLVPVDPGPNLPSKVPLSEDVCMTKSQSDGQNARAGYTNCIKKNPEKACKNQLNQQEKMILATYQACVAQKSNTNTQPTTTPDGDQTVMGITMGPNCLKNGQCSFKIYDLLGIKQDIPAESRTSATFFVQDVLLAATFFIGTIVTVALIWSGVMYILAGASGKDPANAKKGITYSIIGLLLVVGSYSIIRLIQYIAKGL